MVRWALALFVDFPLGTGRSSSADDSHKASALGVAHDEETTLLRQSKREEAVFTFGVIRIVEGDRESVSENG